MNAIDNSALLNIDKAPVMTDGFDPKVAFAYNAGAKTIKMTDDSDFPDGDEFSRIAVKVHDAAGNTVYGNIAAADGDTGDLDISGLDLTNDLSVTATVVSKKGCLSDGTARRINGGNDAGDLGNWTTGQFTTAVIVEEED